MIAIVYRFRRTLPRIALKELICYFKQLSCNFDVIPIPTSIIIMVYPLRCFETEVIHQTVIRKVGKFNILHYSHIDYEQDEE